MAHSAPVGNLGRVAKDVDVHELTDGMHCVLLDVNVGSQGKFKIAFWDDGAQARAVSDYLVEARSNLVPDNCDLTRNFEYAIENTVKVSLFSKLQIVNFLGTDSWRAFIGAESAEEEPPAALHPARDLFGRKVKNLPVTVKNGFETTAEVIAGEIAEGPSEEFVTILVESAGLVDVSHVVPAALARAFLVTDIIAIPIPKASGVG